MRGVKIFLKKFSNDWTMNLASMLTYSLITTIFPILVAILSLAGLVLNLVSAGTYARVSGDIKTILPGAVARAIPIDHILHNVVQLTGPLAIVSLVGLLWGGSNLFTNVENTFSIIYRVKDREFVPQRLMAIGMVIILAILLPASLVASSLITAGSAAFKSFLPGPTALVLTIVGPLTSALLLWLLFLTIYIVVPNIRIPFRDAWRGAATAAIVFALINILFPLYFKIFLSGNSKYGAAMLGILVLIAWLWFFAVILLVGAQVNAFAMGIVPFEQDLAATVAHAGREMSRPAERRLTGRVRGHTPSAIASLGRYAGVTVRTVALTMWMAAKPLVRRAERRSVPKTTHD